MKLRRGMVLILTLLTAALLLLLAGTFLQLNLSGFQFSLKGARDQRATDAALTGLEYARMRLESNARWGLPNSNTNVNITRPGFVVVEDDKYKPSAGITEFVSVGVLDGGLSHFQIELLTPFDPINPIPKGKFLDTDIEANPAGDLSTWRTDTLEATDISLNYISDNNPWNPSLTGGYCPGRALPRTRARLLITGYSSGVRKRVEVTLGPDSFTSAGIAAGRSLVVQANYWNADSKIADTNKINSTSNTILPGVPGDPNHPFMRFRGGLQGNGGTLTSQGQILTGANIITGAGPDGTGGIALTTVGNVMPPSPSNFGEANGYVKGRLREKSSVPPVPALDAQTVDSWSSFGPGRSLPGGTYTFLNEHQVAHSNGTVYTDKINVGSGDLVLLNNWQFIVPENTRLNVSSNLIIAGQGRTPTVAMGYNQWGWLNPYQKGAYLNVQNGNFTVAGSVVGKGSVVVNGTTSDPNSCGMSVQGSSQMSGSADAGVTVYADGPISVSAPTNAQFYSFDWDALAPAIGAFASSGSNKWNNPAKPLADWRNLGQANQDYYMGGAATNDTVVDSSYIRTTRLGSSAQNATLANLTSNFSAYAGNSTVASEFDALVARFDADGGLTPGRYIRLREYLKEAQNALTANLTIPSTDTNNTGGNLSSWADLTQKDGQVNSYLCRELEWFQNKGQQTNWTWNLKDVVFQSKNPFSTVNSRDAQWKGLLYTKQSVLVDLDSGAFFMQGSVVAQKDIVVRRADWVYTDFDPTFFDQLSKVKVGGVTLQKMEYKYFAIY